MSSSESSENLRARLAEIEALSRKDPDKATSAAIALVGAVVGDLLDKVERIAVALEKLRR